MCSPPILIFLTLSFTHLPYIFSSLSDLPLLLRRTGRSPLLLRRTGRSPPSCSGRRTGRARSTLLCSAGLAVPPSRSRPPPTTSCSGRRTGRVRSRSGASAATQARPALVEAGSCPGVGGFGGGVGARRRPGVGHCGCPEREQRGRGGGPERELWGGRAGAAWRCGGGSGELAASAAAAAAAEAASSQRGGLCGRGAPPLFKAAAALHAGGEEGRPPRITFPLPDAGSPRLTPPPEARTPRASRAPLDAASGARPHGPTLPRPRRLQAPPPHDLVRNPATPSSTVPLTFDFIFVGIRFATVRSQKFGSSASAASRSASNRQGPLQRHPRGTCPQDGCAYLTLISIFWFAL